MNDIRAPQQGPDGVDANAETQKKLLIEYVRVILRDLATTSAISAFLLKEIQKLLGSQLFISDLILISLFAISLLMLSSSDQHVVRLWC